MRNGASRLHRIVMLAEAEERQLGALMRSAQARLAAEKDRQGELNAYRQSVDEMTRLGKDFRSAHWKDRQIFVARLDRAMRAQQSVIGDCERNVEMHRRRWQEKRRRAESLARVSSRLQREEQQKLERNEQRALDDRPLTSRAYEGGR